MKARKKNKIKKEDNKLMEMFMPLKPTQSTRISSSSSNKEEISIPKTLNTNQWENALAHHILTLHSNAATSVDVSSANTKNNSDMNSSFMSNTSKDTEDSIDQCNILKELSRTSNKNINHMQPKMIWHSGTGLSNFDWGPFIEAFNVPDASSIKQELLQLETQEKYKLYISKVESIFHTGINNTSTTTSDPRTTLEEMFIKLILVINSFATNCISKSKYASALNLLHHTQELYTKYKDTMFTSQSKEESLICYINDSFAYYYTKRSKFNVALKHGTTTLRKLKQLHTTDDMNKSSISIQIAKCHLHVSYIKYQVNEFQESYRLLKEILRMLEDGLFDGITINNGSSDNAKMEEQLLLLMSITYHNIAVVQICIGKIVDACHNSQNSRRIARLCFSLSVRFIPDLELTHRKALGELMKQHDNNSVESRDLVEGLFE